MSDEAASIIYALRTRADQLDNEALSAEVMHAQVAPWRTPQVLRMMAQEFRIIADMAEAGGQQR